MLFSTKPDSAGKEAAIFRSRQLTEFRWTPVRDIPTYTKKTGKTVFPAGVEQSGMIYSSPEPTDQFITENVSFETLLTALANPDSVLYQKDLNGHNNSWAYFGIVCNGLARYALNINRRYSTKRWPTVPGMRKVADATCYQAEQIALCDVLYIHEIQRSHVALITDILRDETGTIRQVEVSEAIRPTCVRVRHDLADFYEKYKLFALWRYDYVDEVPMPDEYQDTFLRQGIPSLPVIALDHGNKSNYRAYEDVVISVFAKGANTIEIRRDGDLIEKITVSGPERISRKFDQGYYTVTHKTTGENVEFCVTEPQISHSAANGMLTVTANACDPHSQILYMDFRELTRSERAEKGEKHNPAVRYSTSCAALAKVEELTEEEKDTGIITRPVPDDAAYFKIYFKNRYGTWTHTMIRI